MCGIAGVSMRPGLAPDREVLAALDAALAHRGPDGRGLHLDGGTASRSLQVDFTTIALARRR